MFPGLVSLLYQKKNTKPVLVPCATRRENEKGNGGKKKENEWEFFNIRITERYTAALVVTVVVEVVVVRCGL